MNCTELQAAARDYFGSTLAPDARAAFEAHSAGCPACRRFVDLVRRSTCRELAEFLDDYVDERLPRAQAEKFAAHVAVCPPCVAYVDGYRATIRLARDCGSELAEPMPPELVRAILAARKERG